MRCQLVRARLADYLTGGWPPAARTQIRGHMDSCRECWSAWNHLRWDVAAGAPVLEELSAFLGAAFQPYLDSSTQLALDWDAANPSSPREVADFYRSSVPYLYNLTIWEASGNRPRYLEQAAAILVATRPQVVLDYGCGIGSDLIGLSQLAAHSGAGYTVVGCDYASPSTAFLRDRLHRRGMDAQVVEPPRLDTVPPHDVLWIVDTLDHLADLDGQLGPLLAGIRLLVCENLDENRAHGAQRFHHRHDPSHVAALFCKHGLSPVATRPGRDLACWTPRAQP